MDRSFSLYTRKKATPERFSYNRIIIFLFLLVSSSMVALGNATVEAGEIHGRNRLSHKIYRDLEVVTEKPGKPVHRRFAPSEWRGIVLETPREE